jgi:hypothetical protein
MNFYVYAPTYDSNSGGCIVLHKLVHIINTETEHKAYLVPKVLEKIEFNNVRYLLATFKTYLVGLKNKYNYKTNPNFNSPVLKSIPSSDLNNGIVVYPEIVYGNPLQAKNIVRWFLHQPGHFTNEACFGTGELYFKFNQMIKKYELYNSKLSDVELKVIHYPIEIYNKKNSSEKRNGSCHIIRKGRHKNKVHDEFSICIDGLDHSEIADIFKKCEYFISYDDYTAYSLFAILCGCKSIVIPDDNISINEWYPNIKDRYGISYGFSKEQLDWADSTNHYVKDLVDSEHLRSVECVISFVAEVEDYYANK